MVRKRIIKIEVVKGLKKRKESLRILKEMQRQFENIELKERQNKWFKRGNDEDSMIDRYGKRK